MIPDSLEDRLRRVSLPDPPVSLEAKVRAAAGRRLSPRSRTRGFLVPAAAVLLFGLVFWLTLRTPDERSEGSYPQAARDLVEGVARHWKAVQRAGESGDVWVDKKDFAIPYEAWKKSVKPEAKAIADAEPALLRWFEERRSEEALAWRVHSLLTEMAVDRKEPALAAERLDAAIAAYPDTEYPDPAKQSKFHHLVNRRAMLIADAEGPAPAIDYAVMLVAKDKRFCHFHLEPWKERYEGEERRTVLKNLFQRVYQAVVLAKRSEATGASPRLMKIQAELNAEVNVLYEEGPIQEQRAGGDEQKRYFLIGPAAPAKAPPEGYGLVVILPGGDGSADFQPFVKQIWEKAIGERYLAAQLVAVEWQPGQFQRVVWPTQKLAAPGMKFTTEGFVEAVIEDVAKKNRIDRRRVYALAWSSGGPAAYAVSLRAAKPVVGSFIAMSVFHPANLPPIAGAKGHAFYLYQSRDDQVTAFSFAETARRTLRANGAVVELKEYAGGHGWQGDIYSHVRGGIFWLEKNANAAGK